MNEMMSYNISMVCKLSYTTRIKNTREKGLSVTHSHHVEIVVDLSIILLNLLLNLTNT